MRPGLIEQLSRLFMRFPGIGARQATRFAYYLIDAADTERAELAGAIRALEQITRCAACARVLDGERCDTCQDATRDAARLAILERDTNLDVFERSGVYNGHYFVLGATLSELGALTSEEKNRFAKLYGRIKNTPAITEVILAMNATPEGGFTARYIEKILEPFVRSRGLKITRLGRGISTGAEIEYLNRDTLKDALDNRR